MTGHFKHHVTAPEIDNIVPFVAIAIANHCQWQWQFSGNALQPVEKQQKRVAYTPKMARRRFSTQKQRFTLFCSLLRGVWFFFEAQGAERAQGGPNPKGMARRGPANRMARCAAIGPQRGPSAASVSAASVARTGLRACPFASVAFVALALFSDPLSAQSTWGTSSAFDLKEGQQQRLDAAEAASSGSKLWGSSSPANKWTSLDAFERSKPGKVPPALARFKLPSGPKLEQLFAVIAFAEAPRRGYDAIHGSATRLPAKRPTQLTIGEIKAWIKATPGQHHAIGNFQIIPSTLLNLQRRLGLSDGTRFDRKTQNQMGALLVSDAGYSAAVAGSLPLSDFMDNLARIWAGLPLASGKSAYHGYAGNRATVTRAFFAKQVTGILG